MPSVSEIYKFDELTWPEVNEAVAMGKIPILPTGILQRASCSSDRSTPLSTKLFASSGRRTR